MPMTNLGVGSNLSGMLAPGRPSAPAPSAAPVPILGAAAMAPQGPQMGGQLIEPKIPAGIGPGVSSASQGMPPQGHVQAQFSGRPVASPMLGRRAF